MPGVPPRPVRNEREGSSGSLIHAFQQAGWKNRMSQKIWKSRKSGHPKRGHLLRGFVHSPVVKPALLVLIGGSLHGLTESEFGVFVAKKGRREPISPLRSHFFDPRFRVKAPSVEILAQKLLKILPPNPNCSLSGDQNHRF